MGINSVGGGNWVNRSITATFSGQVKPKVAPKIDNKEPVQEVPEAIKPVQQTEQSTFSDLLEAEQQKKHDQPKAPDSKKKEERMLFHNSSFDMIMMQQMLNKGK